MAAWLARPTTPPAPRLMPLRDESGPIQLVPRAPSTILVPPAANQPAPLAPSTAAPKPKLARIKTQKRVAAAAATPPEKKVREGALLDPFGKDE